MIKKSKQTEKTERENRDRIRRGQDEEKVYVGALSLSFAIPSSFLPACLPASFLHLLLHPRVSLQLFHYALISILLLLLFSLPRFSFLSFESSFSFISSSYLSFNFSFFSSYVSSSLFFLPSVPFLIHTVTSFLLFSFFFYSLNSISFFPSSSYTCDIFFLSLGPPFVLSSSSPFLNLSS